ncbi:TetR/AcrR family transcriptional regulator [Herbiconiux ginsengi]|uniref:Transcriptional regulator, TetR family n=1 Tax=Herbiconiux ginsengi TaxID=381665 RepID=A0A1H3LAB4_9MICO|nr:TetR/AcrR family transcriptional regulator [Herbiconiux ginsengi]SDY61119.1 transcriptional regulator, TetR family [Herbiconiux ginsengi]
MDATEQRAPRADARLNRERLLEAAAHAFAADGPAASLKDIAKEAGVGIGTLYRHFPTRESLIEAAHESELTQLCGSVDTLLDSAATPEEALRTWLGHWIEYLRAKDGLARALRATAGASPHLDASRDPAGRAGAAHPTDASATAVPHRGSGVAFPGARALALDAVGRLLAAGVRTGSVRADVEPLDVLVAGNGIALAALTPAQADRLLAYLLDALRPRL